MCRSQLLIYFPSDVAISEQLAPSADRNLLDISYILVRHLYLVRMILHAGIFTLENTRAIHWEHHSIQGNHKGTIFTQGRRQTGKKGVPFLRAWTY
jgi:hypothetical protein